MSIFNFYHTVVVWVVFLWKSHFEALLLVPEGVTVFEDTAFKEILRLKWNC